MYDRNLIPNLNVGKFVLHLGDVTTSCSSSLPECRDFLKLWPLAFASILVAPDSTVLE